MASKFLSSSITLLVAVNFLFFSLATCTTYFPAPPKATTLTAVQKSKPRTLTSPHPAPTTYPTPTPYLKSPPPKCPTPPTPKSPGKLPKMVTCPRDALKLGVCANIGGGSLGIPDKQPCCALLEGLSDLEAAICLCTAIKTKVLGLNHNLPVDLSLLLNSCGKKAPAIFKCN